MNTASTIQPTIAQLQGNSLANLVQAHIEGQILAGALQGGDKLTEQLLAEQLGVSRAPVREAFRMLEEAGLVRTEACSCARCRWRRRWRSSRCAR
jgi:DNA-binding GntR family transcriptional regulator